MRTIRNERDHAWIVYWIRACCVLHNLLHDDEYDEEWTVREEDTEEPAGPRTQSESSERGRKKREELKRIVLSS